MASTLIEVHKVYKLQKICAVIFLTTALLVAGLGSGRTAEVITRFDARIEAGADGVLTVVETIQVVAEGNKIKRGIFRDFPTRFKDNHGRFRSVSFDVISVRRNDEDETYRLKKSKDGVRLYIGNACLLYTSPSPRDS